MTTQQSNQVKMYLKYKNHHGDYISTQGFWQKSAKCRKVMLEMIEEDHQNQKDNDVNYSVKENRKAINMFAKIDRAMIEKENKNTEVPEVPTEVPEVPTEEPEVPTEVPTPCPKMAKFNKQTNKAFPDEEKMPPKGTASSSAKKTAKPKKMTSAAEAKRDAKKAKQLRIAFLKEVIVKPLYDAALHQRDNEGLFEAATGHTWLRTNADSTKYRTFDEAIVAFKRCREEGKQKCDGIVRNPDGNYTVRRGHLFVKTDETYTMSWRALDRCVVKTHTDLAHKPRTKKSTEAVAAAAE